MRVRKAASRRHRAVRKARRSPRFFCALGAVLATLCTAPIAQESMMPEKPLVIAHRGASAYVPEHTLPAKALAHAMGADFIEQDVVLSSDGVPVVLHDVHLEATTDVAEQFPDRGRNDGHFYAIDFTFEELRRLRAHERRGPDGAPVFPSRFPGGPGLSQIPSLAEEIALIDGLNQSRGVTAGLYIEMKGTAFHRAEGQDLPAAVLRILKEQGGDQRVDAVFLQSFEPEALRYLRNELKTPLPLIQLIGENAWAEDGEVDFDYLRSDAGLDEIATYANGIGPWLMQLYAGRNEQGEPILSDLAQRAQDRGLAVHPYTFRADQLPPGIDDFEELHRLFFVDLQVDGVFSDFPDLSRRYIDALFSDNADRSGS